LSVLEKGEYRVSARIADASAGFDETEPRKWMRSPCPLRDAGCRPHPGR